MSHLNMGTGVGVRFGAVPAHRFVRKVLRIRQQNSGTHFRVLCVGLSDPLGSAHRESAHSWAAGYVCGG
nr:hypothetical protein [Bacteroides intestinalis]